MRVGQFVSFGMGGASKVIESLVRGLAGIESVELLLFYNDQSIPGWSPGLDRSAPIYSRFDNYVHDFELVKIDDISLLNNYGLDVLNVHRPGNSTWELPGFDTTVFSFKIVETNLHGFTKTQADYRVFPSHMMIEGKNITVPHEIIPDPIRRPVTTDNMREELGIVDKFVYGRFGRPSSMIYSTINLEAYKMIEDDSTVFLYGAPPTCARTDSQNLGIKNIIFLNPTVDEMQVSRMYNTFDVYCHSNSVGETFGCTVAEAMIHGKPVVSHVGSPKWPQAQIEVLGNMQHMCVRDNFVGNYAALMKRLKEDRSFYETVSTYVRNRATTLYDFEVVAQKYVEVYKRVCGKT